MGVKNRYLKVLIHALFWLLVLLALNTIFSFRIYTEEITVIEQGQKVPFDFELRIYRILSIGFIFKIIFFYVNTYVLLQAYSANKKALQLLLKIILLFLLCFTAEWLVDRYYYAHFAMNFFPDMKVYVIKMHLLLYCLLLGFSVAYYFLKEWVKNERKTNQLTEEKLRNELILLKYQINPHFLFNTLNNLFSLAQKYNNEELVAGISKLAGLMRYAVYESSRENVSVQEEVNYINDYIGIFKLRIADEDEVDITFKTKGELENYYIAPMLLIPFVENTLKHGIHFKKYSTVVISLDVEDDSLIFKTFNTNHAHLYHNNGSLPGIGLKNVQRRLQLIYPEKHQLLISEEDDFYYVELNILLS